MVADVIPDEFTAVAWFDLWLRHKGQLVLVRELELVDPLTGTPVGGLGRRIRRWSRSDRDGTNEAGWTTSTWYLQQPLELNALPERARVNVAYVLPAEQTSVELAPEVKLPMQIVEGWHLARMHEEGGWSVLEFTYTQAGQNLHEVFVGGVKSSTPITRVEFASPAGRRVYRYQIPLAKIESFRVCSRPVRTGSFDIALRPATIQKKE